jgi:hypothetical protein
MITTALVLGACLALGGAAGAADPPELAGKFKVTATIGDNDFGIAPGTKGENVYKLRCANAACSKVTMTRVDPGGTYKSTLKLSGKTYTGLEGPFPYPSCPDNGSATFTSAHTLKASKEQDGEVTAISGTAATKIQNCATVSFVDYAIKGRLK